MRWVTRERPKIDRIACPWLIACFIDQSPEFLFVPSKDVLRVAEETDAIPYDVPGVELSHVGDRCSFDAFLEKHALSDLALEKLAVIVRAADTSRRRRQACLLSPMDCRKTSETITKCCVTEW
jgi:hypothetical protein